MKKQNNTVWRVNGVGFISSENPTQILFKYNNKSTKYY